MQVGLWGPAMYGKHRHRHRRGLTLASLSKVGVGAAAKQATGKSNGFVHANCGRDMCIVLDVLNSNQLYSTFSTYNK